MSQKDKKDPGPTLENPYVNRNLFREARGRPEPLLRQSTLTLCCLRACHAVCIARVTGSEVISSTIKEEPSPEETCRLN